MMCNKLRDCFCAVVNNSAVDASILHIKPSGGVYEEDSIERKRDTKIIPLSEIFEDSERDRGVKNVK